MRELEHEITLLEMRSEQILIHLQRLAPGSPEAIVARAALDTHVQRLVIVKGERDRLLKEIGCTAEPAVCAPIAKKRTRERQWEKRALALR
jgi:hypothetical protein